MRIGIDLRPLQLHHQYRGIGMHLIELVKNMGNAITADDIPVFYMYYDLPNPITELAILPPYEYEIILLPRPRAPHIPFAFFLRESVYKIRTQYQSLPNDLLEKVDVWLGSDFMLGVPKKDVQVPVIFILYDLIPLLYEREYFPPFFTALRKNGFNIAVRDRLTKYLYKRATNDIATRSKRILSISDSSAEQLGHVVPQVTAQVETVYLGTSWQPKAMAGKVATRITKLTKEPYILYIGGGDPRRRIDHLVTAFERLKHDNPDLKLLLVGKDFTGTDSIPTRFIQDAIAKSHHQKDIKLVGFVSDDEKQLLYEHAVCFAYPTLIEGFGLPILESMAYKCPCVTYRAEYSSVEEVSADGAVVVDPDPDSLYRAITSLMHNPKERSTIIKKGKKRVAYFTWQKNAKQTITSIKQALKQ